MKNLMVLIIVAALTLSTAAAADLGLVKVKNDYQARVAQEIVGKAYTRVEQGYLVSIDSEQAAMLTQAGIEYKTVMPDVDPALTYLIYPHDKGRATPASPDGAVEIGMGLRVVKTDQALSLRPDVHFGQLAVPLTELSAKIQYIPKALSNFIATLEDPPLV